nr:hypothetical protein [Tanacetum cinerariifolium]
MELDVYKHQSMQLRNSQSGCGSLHPHNPFNRSTVTGPGIQTIMPPNNTEDLELQKFTTQKNTSDMSQSKDWLYIHNLISKEVIREDDSKFGKLNFIYLEAHCQHVDMEYHV